MLKVLTKNFIFFLQGNNFFALGARYRLKYNIEAEFRKLKSQRKLTIPTINKLLKNYQTDLVKLGCLITIKRAKYSVSYANNYRQLSKDDDTYAENCHTISRYDDTNAGNFTEISRANISHADNYRELAGGADYVENDGGTERNNDSYADNYREIERTMNIFTPEDSLQNKNIEPSREVMFTPELSRYNNDCEVENERNLGSKIYENCADNLSEHSAYRNISTFLAENSENINKLIPEIQIIEDDFRSSEYKFATSEPCITSKEFFVPLLPGQLPLFNKQIEGVSTIYPSNMSLTGSGLDNFDVESIKTELEICSQILWKNDDFGKEFSQINKTNMSPDCERRHIFPIVHIIEGPNNTTVSINGSEQELCNVYNEEGLSDSFRTCQTQASSSVNEISETDTFKSCGENNEIKSIEQKKSLNTSRLNTTINTDVKTKCSAQETNQIKSSSNDDQKNMTSISNASIIRNLDGSTPSSSTTTGTSKKLSLGTSLSSASKKRQLDGSMTESTGKETTEVKSSSNENQQMEKIFLNSNDDEMAFTATTSEEKTNKVNLKKKSEEIIVNQLQDIKENISNALTEKMPVKQKRQVEKPILVKPHSINDDISKKQKLSLNDPKKPTIQKARVPFRKRFKPPRKLTAKEIREDFNKQDSIMLEKTTTSSSDVAKFHQQLINRPSIKQIQNSEHLAFIVKTNEGFQVIPTETKKKTTKAFSLFKTHHSMDNIDMTIFSDKNAETFEQYLKSNEQDYKKFNFLFQQKMETEVQTFDGNASYLTNTYNIAGTSKSIGNESRSLFSTCFASSFMKRPSAEKKSKPTTKLFGENGPNETLTPDGYFKRNKEDITRIMGKYLINTQSSTADKSVSSMFQNACSSNEDFSL